MTSVECLCVVDDLIQYFFNDVTYVTLIFQLLCQENEEENFWRMGYVCFNKENEGNSLV